ncbi:MAG: ABC transporter permease [Syntrophobacterales bacterium]|jgi:putative ABC transport system permease protein
MDLAVYDLKLYKGRFIATIIGVGLLFTIVLAMNGLYRGNIYEGLSVIKATNPDLWVVERNRGGPFNEQSTLAEDYHHTVKAIPGVEKACPFIYYTLERQIGDQSRHFSIIGYDVFVGLGGPQRIVAGRGLQQAHYEMVADKKLGVGLGDRVPLGLHTYTVVGLTQGAIDTNGDPLVFLSLPDAQEIAYQKDNEEVRTQRERLARILNGQRSLTPTAAATLTAALVPDTHIINAVLVHLKPGADRAAVAANIKNWLYLSVYTTEQEIELMLKGRLAGMTKQLLLFRTLLLIVSVVIIALVIYTFTMEKIRSIAVMKLIGAPNQVIIRLVLEQSLLLTISAFAFALVLINQTHPYFPKTILLVPSDELITFIVVLFGGILASILGLWQAIKTQPAMALGGQ